MSRLLVLTINSGSSSLKFAFYQMGDAETLLLSGGIDRIGHRPGRIRIRGGNGDTIVDEERDLPDHGAALEILLEWMRESGHDRGVDVVAHRVVHGGQEYAEPRRIDAVLEGALERLAPLAPDHLPRELDAIRAIHRAYPRVPQVACFDTAFHRGMPPVAQRYAIPRTLWQEGFLRYGFHGLSYEYVASRLRETSDRDVRPGRAIVAHLGNGASMAALRDGRSVDTTMGFTPAGGLVMSTRSGDLDPGVLLTLIEERGHDLPAVRRMVNRESGLLGVSGISSDMLDLLEQEKTIPAAAEAVELFCYQAKKFLGALAAVLGGLDVLAFTGGIGENSPVIRFRICSGMEHLGLRLEPRRNEGNEPVISPEDSPVSVRVVKTNEERMMARHAARIVRGSEGLR